MYVASITGVYWGITIFQFMSTYQASQMDLTLICSGLIFYI